MPTDFNKTVGTPSPSQGNFDPRHTGINYGDVANTIGSVVDAFKPVKDDGTADLAAYAAQATDIVQSTAGYSTERERLLQGLVQVAPEDKKTLTEYYTQLSRIRSGEMSPLTASARLNKLTKDYIVLHPHLTTKILAVKQGAFSNIGDVAGTTSQQVAQDADLQAVEDLVKTSAAKGISPQEEQEFRHAQVNDELSKLTFAAQQRAGQINEASISQAYLTQTELFYKDMVPKFIAQTKDPNFKGSDILASLVQARGDLVRNTNLLLQKTAIDNKMILTKEFQDDLVAKGVGTLDSLIELAKSTDNPKARAALSENLRTLSENADQTTLRKKFGPFITLLKGTDGMIGWATYIDDNSKKIAAGLLPSLRAQAKTNPKLSMALDFITSPEYSDNLAKSIDQTAHGQAFAPTGNETVDKVKLQANLDYALAPTTPGPEKDAALVVLAGQPHSFEAWDARNDLTEATKQAPEVLDALRRASPKQLEEQASQTRIVRDEIGSIQFNALDPNTPFSIAGVQDLNQFGKTALPPGGLYGDAIRYSSPEALELVARMNQQYRVFSKLMPRPEAQKWAATTLDELKGSHQVLPSHTAAFLESSKKTTPTAIEPVTDSSSAASAGDVTSMLPMSVKAPGMIQNGNIDLEDRAPASDSGQAARQSITIEQDGKYYLIPTTNPKGQKISDEDAVTLFHYTGEHMGIFESEQAANDFAKRLSSYMQKAK